MKKVIIGLFTSLGILLVSNAAAEQQAFNIEVTAFEISTETLNDYVLPDSSNKLPAGGGIGPATEGMTALGPGESCTSYKNIDACKLMETLDSLVKEGKVKVLSNPKINALQGEKASINVGENILYMQKINNDTFKLKKLTGKDGAGIFLEVTPNSTMDGKVLVSYQMIIRQLARRMKMKGAESLDIGFPIISTRESKSSVVLEDGKPVIAVGMNSRDTTFLTVLAARKISNYQ